MAPHRVLFVHSSADRYGADRELALLARTLDRERVDPLVLLPFEGPLVDDLHAAGVEVLTGPLAVVRRELLTPGGLLGLAARARRTRGPLARLIADRAIDIVHANTSVILGLRAVAPRLVVHVHEIYPHTPIVWPAFRRSLLRADALVCVSEATRSALGAGRLIRPGLTIDPHRAPRAPARLALGLPEDAFVAATFGRLSGWKGQEVLGRALAEPEPGLEDAIALIAGAAWPGQEHHEQQLRDLAAEHGLGDRIRLVGFRDDVENVFGAADVVVIPSTRPDPAPNSALEAAAAGCCVVAAGHGGLPEIIRDGETGVLVAPGDHRALARVLADLAADPERRERLGAAAAAEVRARFDPQRSTRAIEDLYDEL